MTGVLRETCSNCVLDGDRAFLIQRIFNLRHFLYINAQGLTVKDIRWTIYCFVLIGYDLFMRWYPSRSRKFASGSSFVRTQDTPLLWLRCIAFFLQL